MRLFHSASSRGEAALSGCCEKRAVLPQIAKRELAIASAPSLAVIRRGGFRSASHCRGRGRERHKPANKKDRLRKRHGHTKLLGTRSTCAMSLLRIVCSLRLSHLMVTPAQFFSVTVP